MRGPRANGSMLHAGGTEGSRLLGRLVDKEVLGSMVRLDLHVPGWKRAEPGQFALLQAEPSRCFLPRALSVADERADHPSFLIAPIGDGTRELCGLARDAPVRVLGPLGKGFDVEALVMGPGRTVIVAGGVGAAPFPLLLSRMAERYGAPSSRSAAGRSGNVAITDLEVLVLLGFRDKAQFKGSTPVREAVSRAAQSGLRCSLEVATEDGSTGPAEKVTDLLARRLRPGDRVAACGPPAMSRGVWDVCRPLSDVEAWFSLETTMACGVGSCHGCLITLADGSGARVCRDGPVFRGERVFGG